MAVNDTMKEKVRMMEDWQRDVFLYAYDTLRMRPSEPLDELRAAPIPYFDGFGNKQTTMLFDRDGRLVHHDLKVYEPWMFKHQERGAFKKYHGARFTWQQTVILEAYQRAITTFDKDSFDEVSRWISVAAGHGIGKTADMSVIALHFLTCFPGSQIGMTASTQQQVEDIFMKEFWIWKEKLPVWLSANFVQTADHIRVDGSEDWFLRAQVARAEKPEALAGLHAPYVLILVDECSGVPDNVIETMKGALTGINFIVLYFSNNTRTEGEFYESQTDEKKGAMFVHLSFNAEESPIVSETSLQRWLDEAKGDRDADVYRVRVRGLSPHTEEMDEKGWMPFLANVRVLFEPERMQVINRGIIGVDADGNGSDEAGICIRDNIYMKLAFNGKTSSPQDGARKVEMVRDTYNCITGDIGVDAFGVGAKWVVNIRSKSLEDGQPNALLTDKPREGTELLYNSFKSELCWKFREWIIAGGIIITNNQKAWMDIFEKIKYKRDRQGRIMFMDKVTFKKLYKFSPDRFDAAIHTFFKDTPTMPVMMKKDELATIEGQQFMARANAAPPPAAGDPFSSM